MTSKINKCQYCDKSFKTKQSKCNHISKFHYDIHIKYKNVAQNINGSNSGIVNNIEGNNNVINNVNTINNNTINNNTINNYNIAVNKFREEKYDKLTQKDNINILYKGSLSPILLVKLLHCNDKIPENHNVYVNNLRSKYCNIYDGKQWVIKRISDVIDDILLDKSEYLTKIANDKKCIKDISKSLLKGVERAIDFCENPEDPNTKVLKKEIIDGIVLELYNGRTVINKIRNKRV